MYLCINKSNNYHNLKEYKTKRSSPNIKVANEKQSDSIRDKVYVYMYDFEEQQDKEYFKAEAEIEAKMQALQKEQEDLYSEKTLKSNCALEKYIEAFQIENPEYFI